MDTLSRLSGLVLAALLAVLSASGAWAQTCVNWVSTAPGTGKTGSGPTAAAACSALGSQLSGSSSNASNTDTWLYSLAPNSGQTLCTGTFKETICTVSTGSCSTTNSSLSGFPLGSGSGGCTDCQKNVGKAAGTSGTELLYGGGTGASPAFSDATCFNGCLVSGGTGAIQAAEHTNSGWSIRGDASGFSYTGGSCTGNNTSPSTCPSGQAPGTVNGAPVCVAVDQTTTKQTKTDQTQNPNGTTTTTSQSTVTTCNGAGACQTVTTTTTNNSSGGVTTGVQTTTQDKGALCAASPGNAVCGSGGKGTGTSGNGTGGDPGPSSFGGACGAFSCSGDAVQCAIAMEEHKRNCQMFDTATTISDIGTNAATGQNPQDHPKNAPENIAIDLSSKLSAVPLFGGSGQCPQDVAFSHAGYSFSLPFSRWCPYLQLLGAAVMAAAYLSAAFIVFRRG